MRDISRRRRLRMLLLFLLLIPAALLPISCRRVDTPAIPPADPDIRPPRNLPLLSRIAMNAYVGRQVKKGVRSGYVAIFGKDGYAVHSLARGWSDIDGERPMTMDTRFRIASMTKPVTAAAAMILVDEGKLNLADPVSRYVPAAGSLRVATAAEADASGAVPSVSLDSPLTVEHLLTFTAGIGSGDDDSDLGLVWAEGDLYGGSGSLEDRVERILRAPLYERPGRQWRYGWSADVLAAVVESAAGEPFGKFVERRILQPLGMESTGFLSAMGYREDFATMYTQNENKELMAVNEPASDAPEWTPGGSGLVSTASDYLRFAMMLGNGGAYNGVRILSEEAVRGMTRAHVPDGVLSDEDIEGLGWGYGLAVVVDSKSTPTADRNGDFWWSGYYGTTFFVSPRTGLTGVILTQNQPGPWSDRPVSVYVIQALAFLGAGGRR